MLMRRSRHTVNNNRTRHKARRGRTYSRLMCSEQLEHRLLLTAYASLDVPKSIPDRSTITSTLSVPDAVTIDDLNVQLDITHTSDQDLDLYLIAPDGTRVELFTDAGGSGENFSGTTLDEEAATSITAGSAPFNGSFQPEGNLSTLDGRNAQGDWFLEITDDKRRNTGAINSWSIDVTPQGATLSIDDVQLAEGDSGTTAFCVHGHTQRRIHQGLRAVTLPLRTARPARGAITLQRAERVQFLAGETSKTITVQVNGDTSIEPDETFTVNSFESYWRDHRRRIRARHDSR